MDDLQSPAQRIKAAGQDDRLQLRRAVSYDRSRIDMPGDTTLVRSSSAPTFKQKVTGSSDELVRTSSAQRIMMDRQRRGSLNSAESRNPVVNEMIVCSPLSLGSPEQRLGRMSPVAAMIASSTPPPPAPLAASKSTEEKKPKKKKKKKESFKDMMAAMTVALHDPFRPIDIIFWLELCGSLSKADSADIILSDCWFIAAGTKKDR